MRLEHLEEQAMFVRIDLQLQIQLQVQLFLIFVWLQKPTPKHQNGFERKMMGRAKGGPEIGKLTPMGFQVFWGSEGGR